MRKLLGYLLGRLRTWRGGVEPDPDERPRYGTSVSYTPCHECGEGSLVYDEDRGASVCRVCGAVDDGPDR